MDAHTLPTRRISPVTAAVGPPCQRILDLVQQAHSLGWDQAWWHLTRDMRARELATLEHSLGIQAREGWQFLVSLAPEAVALDFGSGWGPLSLGLAEKVAQVVSVDPSPERLQLLRLRAQQRGLHNLQYVQGGDALPLPFPDHCFDLVNLGGSLERIPSFIAGNPRRVQRRFLEEIRRILKPTGQVYAGLENRFALKFFHGRAPQGNGLRYAGLMPRLLAHLYCLLRRGTTFRNYAYSAAGAERLFRQAGFGSVQTLILSPHPANFERVIARADTAQLATLFASRSGWKGLGKRLLGRAGVLPWLVPAFGIVASAGGDRGHFLEQIVRQVSHTQQVHYEIVETLVRDYGGCVLFLRDKGDPRREAVLKLAFQDGGDELQDRAIRNTALMAGTLNGSWAMPRLLESGALQGHSYVLEERLPGSNGWQLLNRGWSQGRLGEMVWDFLEGWMRSTRSAIHMSQADFNQWLPNPSEHWRRLAGPQTASVLGELLAKFRAYMVGRERVMVASHGDLSLGNVLFDEGTGRILGIVDWDSADRRGLPLVDALSLSLYRDEPPFDLGFPDEFAESHPISSLVKTLRHVSTCPEHPRLDRIRGEYGYKTDLDSRMALFLLFLKRHQPSSLAARKQTRKWVEAFRLLLTD